MNYKIIKLDRRHTGYEYFEHAIDIIADKSWNGGNNVYVQTIQFQRCRNWFWQTYGPSADYDIWLKVQTLPSTDEAKADFAVKDWAWETRHGKFRIFISHSPELTHFLLAHPRT